MRMASFAPSQATKERAASRKRATYALGKAPGMIWTIYPAGSGAYACGSPDGPILVDGQPILTLLGGIWVAGRIEQQPYAPARFVADSDASVCGMCAGMQICLLPNDEKPARRKGG
jgi:hypothetical protein